MNRNNHVNPIERKITLGIIRHSESYHIFSLQVYDLIRDQSSLVI